MFRSSGILVCVALVFATTVSSDDRSRRSNLIDLGTSVLLPWESANNARLRNIIYNRAPSSEVSDIINIDSRNINGRNELQQVLKNLGRISNENGNRQQILVRGAINSDLSRNSQRNGGLQRQNGYAGLGSYSTFNNNNQNEEQAWIGNTKQRQVQLDQLRNNQQNDQTLVDDSQSNEQLAKIIALGIQSNRGNPSLNSQADIINAIRIKQLGQQRGPGYSQVNQVARGLNQQGWKNSGRLVGWNNLGQNLAQSDEVLNQQSLWRANQEAEDVDIQQNNPISAQQLNRDGGRLRSIQSWRPWGNSQPIAPVTQEIVTGQQPLNAQWYAQEPSGQVIENVENRPEQLAQIANLGANSGILVNPTQPQNQVVLTQQQPNEYTYGELNAKIWKVLKSNPAMISNLENVREQLLNGRDSGDEQIRKLRGLLQEARQYNRNVLIPGNGIVGQSPEEQQRNVVVANLIEAMNQNENQANPIDVRGHIGYGGWRV